MISKHRRLCTSGVRVITKVLLCPNTHARGWLASCRSTYSLTGIWPEELTTGIKLEIEDYWRPRLQKHGKQNEDKETGKEKCYILSMFPYPSGKLHMGHVRVYAISDAMARFYRMNGKSVIHPMGWDAFGLPAENAAIEKNEMPDTWTQKNIENMKNQFHKLGCSFDWSRELSTCDPDYYRWTQYWFLKMLENDLAYQKEALVNWDPVDQTVLADEQVDDNGCSWRSGAKVEKKRLRQWFLRTTKFSKSLYEGLNDTSLENWRDITKIQQHWIGECNGFSFDFKLRDKGDIKDECLTVWTSVPEFIHGISFIALSLDHILCKCANVQGRETVCRLDIDAVNPFSNKPIPIFASDKISYPVGADARLGIPSFDHEDMIFAQSHGLEVIKILDDSGTSGSVLINSNEFSGMSIDDAREKICKKAMEEGFGGYPTSSKLHDWLISRQRYWGTPIPVIHCANCKVVPVPYEDLPVLLPHVEHFSGKGSSPLRNIDKWVNVACPRCGHLAQRETDTMDTFVDSAWYYLRFLDPHNMKEPFNKAKADQGMPVDIYIGGKEHAAMHLYYARFFNHFCHSLGCISHKEPFKRLLVQGMVMGQTYRSKDSGKYLKADEVEKQDQMLVEKTNKTAVLVQWEKMSKSRHNGVDPNDVIQEYGVDTTRLFMLGDVAPTSNRNWSSSTFAGHLKWQHRLWLTISEFRKHRMSRSTLTPLSDKEFKKYEDYMFDSRNYYVKGVTHNFHRTFQLSVAISKMQGLTNSIRRMPPTVICYGIQYERALASLIIMMAPIMPHFASELWSGFANMLNGTSESDWGNSVLTQPWPDVDMEYNLDIVIKVNGEEIHVLKLPRHQLDNLTKPATLKIIECDSEAAKLFQIHNPTQIDFNLIPGYEADVNLVVPGLKPKRKASKT